MLDKKELQEIIAKTTYEFSNIYVKLEMLKLASKFFKYEFESKNKILEKD